MGEFNQVIQPRAELTACQLRRKKQSDLNFKVYQELNPAFTAT